MNDLNLGSIQGGPGEESGLPDDGQMPPGFMNVDPSKIAEINEREEAKEQLKISEHIMKMDDEFKERFKALKVIQNMMHDADEEEQKEIRKLEV